MGNSCWVLHPKATDALSFIKYNRSKTDQIGQDIEVGKDGNPKHVVKVLLLGTGDSGKSTILKQMKIIHLNGFSDSETKFYVNAIRGNLIDAMVALVEGVDQLGEFFEKSASVPDADRIQSISRTFKESNKIGSLTELRYLLNQLWSDSGIQKCYERANELKLIDSAGYFLNRIDEVMSDGYRPSNDDILRTRIISTGITETSFTIEDLCITMIDVGGQRIHRKKWLRCFDSIQAVIFVASLAEYDQVLDEDNKTNRTRESIYLFGQICEHGNLRNTNMILFLNKKDLFAAKLKTIPLKTCFPEYTGPNRYREASVYLWNKFEEVRGPKNLFSHVTCATNTENLKVVFGAVTEMLVRSRLVECGVL